MKIAIFGVGAMGSVYAALLADAGHEVVAIDVWQEHIDVINRHGLRLEGASGDRTVTSIRATSDPKLAKGADLFIIATKASGVGPVAQALAPLLTEQSLILTIQNGLGAGERIAEHMPTHNVLIGVAQGFGASIRGPGHAHHNGMSLIRIGELGGGMTARLDTVAELWRGAGFEVKAFADIQQLVWEKFLCNGTFSAPCTAFDCTIGQLMSNADQWNIALGCAQEIFELGLLKKIAFSFDEPVSYVTAFGHRMPDARPSMLLDHHAKRPSEIDAINGMAVTLGREMAIETPYNACLTAVVKAREAAWDGSLSKV